jgi:hypothetical protein
LTIYNGFPLGFSYNNCSPRAVIQRVELRRTKGTTEKRKKETKEKIKKIREKKGILL